MPELDPGATLALVTGLVFGAVALLVAGLARGLTDRERVRRRYVALAAGFDLPAAQGTPGEGSAARPVLDPARLGLDPDAQRALRVELIRAGFFDPAAIATFAAARVALPVLLPAAGLLIALGAGVGGTTERLALLVILALVAVLLPRAVLAARQRALEAKYRATFPDYLDMLVVCINAGLGLEAALDRAGRELGDEDAEFRANLELMAGEMRAGKSTADALRALGDRLGLREARAFSGLLQQTIELGTDVAGALAIFSDEMRDKRLSSAEERAAALPPKLTLPLGLFIFPVVLIVVLAPAVMRIASAVGN